MGNVCRLVNEGHAAENVDEVVEALAASFQMALLTADTLRRVKVDVALLAIDLERAKASKLRGHVVESDILAVEVLINVVADSDRVGEVIRGVVVKEGNVGEAQVGQNHRVDVLTRLVGAESVLPLVVLELGAARQSTDEPEAAELAPRLEDELEILGVVVDVVIGEKKGLGLVLGVGDELLVEAVGRRHPVVDLDTKFRLIVGGSRLVEVVPDDPNFEEGWDLLAQKSSEGAVELLRALVGLHDDTAKIIEVSFTYCPCHHDFPGSTYVNLSSRR